MATVTTSIAHKFFLFTLQKITVFSQINENVTRRVDSSTGKIVCAINEQSLQLHCIYRYPFTMKCYVHTFEKPGTAFTMAFMHVKISANSGLGITFKIKLCHLPLVFPKVLSIPLLTDQRE